jgi:hypothetical protein
LKFQAPDELAVVPKWARSPSFLVRGGEPPVGSVMLDMSWVGQHDEDVDIDQKPFQPNSSRNRFTSSDVTLAMPARTGKRGTPFRVFRRDSSGFNAPPGKRRDDLAHRLVLRRGQLLRCAQHIVINGQGCTHPHSSTSNIMHQMHAIIPGMLRIAGIQLPSGNPPRCKTMG